jgi:hypothetical protein
MGAISITRLYSILQAKLGKETAENLTTFIEEKMNADMESKLSLLATKQYLHDLKLDLKDVRQDLISRLNDQGNRLDVKIGDSKSETIKWMFIFWIGQLAAMFGFLLLFVKK